MQPNLPEPQGEHSNISFKPIILEIVSFPTYVKIPHWSLTCSGINPSSGCDPCAAECPEGSFGPGCESSCQCQNGAACDHVSGACTCTAGWTGTFCEKGTAAAPAPFRIHGEFGLVFIQRAAFTIDSTGSKWAIELYWKPIPKCEVSS